jgi:hypothetical protein
MPKNVTVEVRHPAIGEGSITYFRGAQFTTTEERAKALGDAVVIVGDAPEPAPAAPPASEPAPADAAPEDEPKAKAKKKKD